MNNNKVPTGLALTPMNEAFKQDPYPILQELRERAPVHHDTDLNRYFFTGYDDVKRILRSTEYLTDPRKSKDGSFARMMLREDEDQLSMLLLDEPEQKRLRMLVNHLFTPRAVSLWRPRIVEVVEQQLNTLGDKEFDLIADYAAPIPTIVIAKMMGVSTEHQSDFKRWSEVTIQAEFSLSKNTEQANAGREATKALQDFFREQVSQRRENPGTDVISQMLAARFDGDQLTEMEIINQCELLLIAGNVTTSDLIGNGIKALLEHPEQLEKLRGNPALIHSAVEEILRFDSPVMSSGRITHTSIDISGCPIGPGETLGVSLAAANRDPRVFSKPNEFNIERRHIAHQSFGGGRHHCLGASLAVVEAQEAILRLVQRFEHLRFSSQPYVYATTPSFRGMQCCQLRTDSLTGNNTVKDK